MQNPTPQTPQYELVAQISKTKGLDGQLVAQELGELSVLYPGLEVWVVPPAPSGIRHTFVAEVVKNRHKSGVLLSLEGVVDRTQASQLTGRYLLAKLEGENSVQAGFSKRSGVEQGLADFEQAYAVDKRGFTAGEQAHQEQETLWTQQPSQSPQLQRSHQQQPQPPQSPQQQPLGISFIDSNYGNLGKLETVKPGAAYDIWVLEGPYGHLEIPAVDAYVVSRNTEAINLALPAGFVEITGEQKENSRDASVNG